MIDSKFQYIHLNYAEYKTIATHGPTLTSSTSLVAVITSVFVRSVVIGRLRVDLDLTCSLGSQLTDPAVDLSDLGFHFAHLYGLLDIWVVSGEWFVIAAIPLLQNEADNGDHAANQDEDHRKDGLKNKLHSISIG